VLAARISGAPDPKPNRSRISFVWVANEGFEAAIRSDSALRRGVNVHRGVITHAGVAESLGAPYTPLDDVLGDA
jgi:alanine dehydrogenase